MTFGPTDTLPHLPCRATPARGSCPWATKEQRRPYKGHWRCFKSANSKAVNRQMVGEAGGWFAKYIILLFCLC